MARPGLLQHRKFMRLAKRLKSRAHALGTLELLWSPAYESGDDHLGDAEDIAIRVDWHGDAAEVVAVLMDGGVSGAGFIEPCGDHQGCYRIHDLWDHAPDYVATRAAREADRQSRGITLSQVRAEAGRRGAAVANARRQNRQTGGKTGKIVLPTLPTQNLADHAKTDPAEGGVNGRQTDGKSEFCRDANQPETLTEEANERQTSGKRSAKVATPAPAPAPIQLPGGGMGGGKPEPLELLPQEPPPPGPEDLQALWNRLRAPEQPEARELGKARRQAAARALERRSLAAWGEVFQRIAASTTCRGLGDLKWVADFDFAIRPEGKKREPAAMALEGKYDNRGAGGGRREEPLWEDVP